MKKPKEVKISKEFEEYIQSLCWSCWEGCACNEPKGHTGLHVCGADECDCTWTDEQEQEFMTEMRAWTGDYKSHEVNEIDEDRQASANPRDGTE